MTTPTVLPTATPPAPAEDDHADDPEAATALELDASTAGAIERSFDIDVFIFVAESGKSYGGVVELGTLRDAVLTLYAPDGTCVLTLSLGSGDAGPARVQQPATQSGAYYLAVRSAEEEGVGTYSVTAYATSDAATDDHGNAPCSATALEIDEVIAGTVDEPDNVDTFSFQATQDDYYIITVDAEALGSAGVVILHADGHSALADNESPLEEGLFESELRWLAGESDTFYLALESAGNRETGPYSLTIAVGTAPAAEEPTPETASALPGGEAEGQFRSPRGVAIDASGAVYVADTVNHRVQLFGSDGRFLRAFGSAGSGNGELQFPVGLALDSTGNLYVADQGNHRVQVFDSNGQFLRQWGSRGSGDGTFQYPSGVAVDQSDRVYVTDTLTDRGQVFSAEGVFQSAWSTGAGAGQLLSPQGLTVDAEGNVLVAGGSQVRTFDTGGSRLGAWGSLGTGDGQLQGAWGVAVDQSGDIYVADQGNHRVQVFDSEGRFVRSWGSEGTGDTEFQFPQDLAVDGSDKVYVTDTSNNRVQVFSSEGELLDTRGP